MDEGSAGERRIPLEPKRRIVVTAPLTAGSLSVEDEWSRNMNIKGDDRMAGREPARPPPPPPPPLLEEGESGCSGKGLYVTSQGEGERATFGGGVETTAGSATVPAPAPGVTSRRWWSWKRRDEIRTSIFGLRG